MSRVLSTRGVQGPWLTSKRRLRVPARRPFSNEGGVQKGFSFKQVEQFFRSGPQARRLELLGVPLRLPGKD